MSEYKVEVTMILNIWQKSSESHVNKQKMQVKD